MKHARLDDMVKGWFVGAFAPTVLFSDAVEVAVKHYKAGDVEAAHYHAVATELTLIVEGTVRMCGSEFGPGDIVVLEPGEITEFEALTHAINVVVKTPS